jgi:hypothetical protein
LSMTTIIAIHSSIYCVKAICGTIQLRSAIYAIVTINM